MDRRDFIKTTAMAAAAATVPAALSGCDSAKGPQQFNVSRIGKARMKLSFEPYDLQLRHTFTVSSYSRTTTPGVQVRIEYDGYVGYGEASMPPYLGHTVDSVCQFLSRVDLGQFADPFHIEDILAYVDSLSEGGEGAHGGRYADAPAKAAVDIALHDLVGKLIGQPWFRLCGLDAAKAPATSFTIGIDTPEVVREKTIEALGLYKVLKVKVGLDSDKEMINTIREITDVPLVVDANQGWKDKYKALDMICWLHERGVQMAEQPMPKEMLDDIAWVTERSPMPIFADESIQRLCDIPRIKGAFSGINIKLMKCTGINEARKMITYARAENMKVMMGCMTETSCAVTAAAHLSPAVDFADLDGNLLISNDLFEGVTVNEGLLTLPDRPGLGLRKIR